MDLIALAVSFLALVAFVVFSNQQKKLQKRIVLLEAQRFDREVKRQLEANLIPRFEVTKPDGPQSMRRSTVLVLDNDGLAAARNVEYELTEGAVLLQGPGPHTVESIASGGDYKAGVLFQPGPDAKGILSWTDGRPERQTREFTLSTFV